MLSNPKYGIREDKSKTIFVGTYQRTGAKLSHIEEPTIRLVIGTRLNPTKLKPKHFLLLMEGRDRSAIYFSSMYQTDNPSMFEIEHQGIRYIFMLSSDKAEIVLSNQALQAA
jgi:hypothetical protein